MIINKTKRIIKAALNDLLRNVWLNIATMSIIIVTLFTITTMLAVDTVGNFALSSLQEKIDITIQFKEDANEDKILELRKDLEELQEVKSVEYISKEQALADFKESHQDNQYINQSLEELGENPLFAVLNVKATSLGQYKSIDEYIKGNENYGDIIEKINFKENEKAINNFSTILKTVKDSMFGLAILFIFMSILVAFNTIRLAMYTHRVEIEIMRLVGASNWYIKMPFVVEGAVLGVLGGAVTIAFVFPIIVYASPKVAQFLPGFDLHAHFLNNILNFALLIFSLGMGLGVVSSLIAIRRYLKA